MKLFGLFDCGCDQRKAWLISRIRRAMWSLLGVEALAGGGKAVLATGRLTARIIRADGRVEELDLGFNTITDAAVAFLVDDFDLGGATTDVTLMNNHHWGTGVCVIPPACTVTGLVTPGTEARVAGTKSQPAANQFRTVGTLTADGAKTITEWALFSASAGGTGWSVRCFTGVALALNDSIEFTYTATFNCVTG